jgi:DnaJ-class molecular chaperone
MEVLLVKCDVCRGEGRRRRVPRVTRIGYGACDKCGGAGSVMTAAGKAVATLIRHVSAGGK